MTLFTFISLLGMEQHFSTKQYHDVNGMFVVFGLTITFDLIFQLLATQIGYRC